MASPDKSLAINSPELRLLLSLLRVAVGRPALPPVSGSNPFRWPVFVALAERHRVVPVLCARAASELAATCPPAVVSRLQQSAAANARRALALAADQIALTDALAKNGIEAIALKGTVLAQRLYGNIAARHAGDIDLLIRPADAIAADRLLLGLGLRRSRPDFPLTPGQTKKYIRFRPEFEYLRASPPLRAELLWRLELLDTNERLWAHPPEQKIGQRSLRTLPPGIEIPYLFAHGARHAWFRLFWLIDVAMVLNDPSIPWPAIVGTARAAGTERALLQGAALAEELLGVPCPPALRPQPGEHRTIAALVAEARRQIGREPREHEAAGEWLRQLHYRVHLSRRLAHKWATLTPHIVTPESWRTWPLPDRWFFLYYAAGPFLWVWRRLRPRALHAPSAPVAPP